jgi:hypothetical protein
MSLEDYDVKVTVSSASEWGSTAGFCEHGSEPLASIKAWEVVE